MTLETYTQERGCPAICRACTFGVLWRGSLTTLVVNPNRLYRGVLPPIRIGTFGARAATLARVDPTHSLGTSYYPRLSSAPARQLGRRSKPRRSATRGGRSRRPALSGGRRCDGSVQHRIGRRGSKNRKMRCRPFVPARGSCVSTARDCVHAGGISPRRVKRCYIAGRLPGCKIDSIICNLMGFTTAWFALARGCRLP